MNKVVCDSMWESMQSFFCVQLHLGAGWSRTKGVQHVSVPATVDSGMLSCAWLHSVLQHSRLSFSYPRMHLNLKHKYMLPGLLGITTLMDPSVHHDVYCEKEPF